MKYFVIIRVDISIVVNKLSLIVKPGITIRNSFKFHFTKGCEMFTMFKP